MWSHWEIRTTTWYINRGKKSSLTFPVKQIQNIVLEHTQAPESMDLGNAEDKVLRMNLEAPPEMHRFQIQPVITQKTKKIQDRSAGVSPDQWPLAQTHLHMTDHLYMSSEVMDLVQQFWQKPGESILVWLLRLWNMRVESVVVKGLETSKLASIT